MKRYDIMKWAVAAALTATSVACSDEKTYDVDGNSDNIAYVNPHQDNVYETTIMHTSFGTVGYVGARIGVYLQRPAQKGVMVSLAPDASLVAEYNAGHDTKHTAFPDDAIKALQSTAATFDSNPTRDTATVLLPEDKLTSLTAESYVLPLRVSTVGSQDGGVRGSTNHGVAYVVVRNQQVDNFVSLDKQTADCNIIKTPVGTFGGIMVSVKPTLAAAVAADWQATAVIDASLINDYNAQHATNYEALPADAAAAITIVPTTIAAGSTTPDEGIKVDAPVEKLKNLTGSYLIPLRIRSTYKGQQIEEQDDVVYVTLGVKESLINDDADELSGKLPSDEVRNTWVATNCDNLDPAQFSSAFTTSWGGWAFRSKQASAAFTIDMQREQPVTGFYLSGYVMSGATVELSSDGVVWTSVGNTDEHEAVQKYDESWTSHSEYVFYSPVRCRYIRFTIRLDEDSWAWNYGGYSTLRNLSVYLAD